MSNPKHTPGPISIDREHLRRTDEILLCRDAGSEGNGELVAKVYGDYGFALKAAAAPEMLDALKYLYKSGMTSDAWRHVEPHEHARIQAFILKIILKATGGAE